MASSNHAGPTIVNQAMSHSNLYPLSNFLSYSFLSSSHKKFTLAISSIKEPNSYKEVVKHDSWRQAVAAEIIALEHNNTWVFTDLPPNKKAIGYKWVYKVKYRVDGTLEHYKARLVAIGFTQTEGLDFLNTFSPVAKITTIYLLLALAATQHRHLKKLDVNNTFLHGDLHEDVYMQLLEGVVSPKPNQVCKLQKSLYGLCQASRQWFSKLSSALLFMGYKQS